jgi:carbon storage regulator
MLVLSRKEGERLVIGENVIITVNRISGNRITLGIDAPRDVRIVRGELEPLPGSQPANSQSELVKNDRPVVTFELDMASVGTRVAG